VASQVCIHCRQEAVRDGQRLAVHPDGQQRVPAVMMATGVEMVIPSVAADSTWSAPGARGRQLGYAQRHGPRQQAGQARCLHHGGHSDLPPDRIGLARSFLTK
jgi:hypothetical protein